MISKNDLLLKVKSSISEVNNTEMFNKQKYTDLVSEILGTYSLNIKDEETLNQQINKLDYIALGKLSDKLNNFISKIKEEMQSLLSSHGILTQQTTTNEYRFLKDAKFMNRNTEQTKALSDYLYKMKKEGKLASVIRRVADSDLDFILNFHYPPTKDLAQIGFEDGMVHLYVDQRISSVDLQKAINYTKQLIYNISNETGVQYIQFSNKENKIVGRDGKDNYLMAESMEKYQKYNLPFEKGIVIMDLFEMKDEYRKKTKEHFEAETREGHLAVQN